MVLKPTAEAAAINNHNVKYLSLDKYSQQNKVWLFEIGAAVTLWYPFSHMYKTQCQQCSQDRGTHFVNKFLYFLFSPCMENKAAAQL